MSSADEWADLQAARLQSEMARENDIQAGSEAPGLQNLQTSKSNDLQNSQHPPGEDGLNHSLLPVSIADELPEELKVFARVNRAKTMEGAMLAYARVGITVVPYHSVDASGACSCGKADCDNPGKHPRWAAGTLEHGVNDATTDAETIRNWSARWADANTGVWAGGAGWLVIDVDLKGVGAFRALAERHQLPPTLTARSGSGGFHYVYRAPEGLELGNRSGTLPPGIDVRGAGGCIIVAPSVHKTGQVYTWADIRPIALFPDRLIGMLAHPRRRGHEDGATYGQKMVPGCRRRPFWACDGATGGEWFAAWLLRDVVS